MAASKKAHLLACSQHPRRGMARMVREGLGGRLGLPVVPPLGFRAALREVPRGELVLFYYFILFFPVAFGEVRSLRCGKRARGLAEVAEVPAQIAPQVQNDGTVWNAPSPRRQDLHRLNWRERPCISGREHGCRANGDKVFSLKSDPILKYRREVASL